MFFILASLAQIMAAAMPAVFTAASASPSELGVTLVGQTLLSWWPNFECPPVGVEGYWCLPQNHRWSANICSLLCLWFSPHSLLSCRPAKSSGRLGVVSKFWEWSSPSSNTEDTCTIGNLLTTLEHTSFSYYGIHATSSLASLITSLKETSAKACHMCPWYRPCLNTLNCWLHCPMICDKKQSLDANCYVWVAGVTSPGSSLGMPGPDRERWKFVWKTPEFQCSI